MGWSLFPARYWVMVENGLSEDTVIIQCEGTKIKMPAVAIPVKNSYNFSIYTYMLTHHSMECTVTRPNVKGETVTFLAFDDSIHFIDHRCGARHCHWKAADDGIYLFNYRKNRYNFVTGWLDTSNV
ncbi:hypothetical protein RND81_04G093600 [Saponaria officinalis]|uniref:S-protein homolog n=1 Tax=Saponaria officinalis TaxID=3572 RepID=A0AAW1LJD0_SAPOF